MPQAIIKEFESHNIPFTARLVTEGEKYGLNNCLTHDKPEPLVEFYDRRYPHTEHGQFISRYYLTTILQGNDGINLYGGVPDWYVDTQELNDVRQWLKEQEVVQPYIPQAKKMKIK